MPWAKCCGTSVRGRRSRFLWRAATCADRRVSHRFPQAWATRRRTQARRRTIRRCRRTRFRCRRISPSRSGASRRSTSRCVRVVSLSPSTSSLTLHPCPPGPVQGGPCRHEPLQPLPAPELPGLLQRRRRVRRLDRDPQPERRAADRRRLGESAPLSFVQRRADDSVLVPPGSQWQSSPVAIAYAFNTTVRGLLASLPTPMPQYVPRLARPHLHPLPRLRTEPPSSRSAPAADKRSTSPTGLRRSASSARTRRPSTTSAGGRRGRGSAWVSRRPSSLLSRSAAG